MQQLGKYQLVRKLATGGMAEVYLAKAAGPMGFEKTLVLKRILPHLAEDPAFVEMFLGEAKLAAQLNHPNIVQIFDFGEADGEYFLAMEYIDGPNLRVLLKKAQTAGLVLPPALCARFIASACEGLAFAHDFNDPETGQPLGLIHRDISPDNILVSRQGAVKVVDFGIAKAAGQSHKTQTGMVKGKLAYMPPEQVRAKPLDRRVDVYALGVVLYELLTGQKPYDAPTDASLMQAILFEPQVPAVQHRPDLPEALHRILDRCLAKDREQRYADCLGLAAELEEFILSVGKPVTTQQVVQLIAQVSPHSDSPMPTPQGGTPRSGSKSAGTPVHTPAPSHVGTGSGTKFRSDVRPAHGSQTGDMAAPLEPSPDEAPVKTVALDTTEATATKKETKKKETTGTQTEASVGSGSQRRWLPAAVGVVLLAAGGGVVLWKSSADPEPEPKPIVLEQPPPKPPVEQPPPPEPTPEPTPPPQIAEAPTPGPSPTPPTPQPSPEPETPPKVAELDPRPTSPRTPKTPKQPSVTQKTPKTPVVVGKGTFSFRVRPYATVIINGKNLGQTPFDPVEFPAGKYTVRFVNDDLKKNVTQVHELKPGENKVVKLNLEE
jgi:serine/threonine-protein kinase